MVKREERPNASTTTPTAAVPDAVYPSQVAPPNFPTTRPVLNVYPTAWNSRPFGARGRQQRGSRGHTGDDMLHLEYLGDAGHVMNLDIVLNNVSKGSIHTWGDRMAGPGQVLPEVQLTRQILPTRGAQRALQGRI
ncbi:hypothetical protein XENOCAPTIV_027552, partial [Xenoophorus captivus]